MGTYRGEEGSVKFDDAGSSANAISSTRSWQLTLDKAVLETTAMQSNYAGKIGSIISGTGSAELFYTATTGETQAFVDHINTVKDDGTALFELYLSTGDNKKISFDAVVNSADFTATVGEISVITIGFETNGTITTSSI